MLKTLSLPFFADENPHLIMVTAVEPDGSQGERAVARTDRRLWNDRLRTINISICE